MNDSVPLPKEHREFVNIIKCPLARAYAEICPHEYIVRDRVDDGLFVSLVNHIGVHGHEARLYRKPITCSDEDGLVYWTMGESVEFTTIVNRCLSGRTYEHRLKAGTIPEQINQAEQGSGGNG